MNSFGERVCEKCESGKVTTVAGSSACSYCAPGYVANSSQCSACSPGKYKDEYAGICKKCSRGRFAPMEGSRICSLCDQGR